MVKENRLSSEKCNKELGVVDEFRKNFRRHLEIYRKRKEIENGGKLTLSDVKAEMAEKINVDIKTISNWNTRGIPSLDNILEVAKFFGCSIDELLTGRNPYNEVMEQLEKSGVTKEFMDNLENLLRETPRTTKDIFGKNVSKAKWGTRKFIIDLFSSSELMEILGYYYKISNAFASLNKNEKEVCLEKLKSFKTENDDMTLKLLIPELPDKVQEILIENINNMDRFESLSRASYILKIFYDEVSDSKKDS